ncbi:hypothetical protein RKD23_003698 [Streptomyces sp. SAI-170]|uniref:VWA domain-containing protein n=1 Tax=Streptomyces sp. SAI-170 TaxID=3377729 RepID=UPI003C7D85F1
MGILTLLRNTFGRSRKSRHADPEGTNPTPATPEPTTPAPQVPEPRTSSSTDDSEEHELVAAAFDKVAVPRPTRSGEDVATGEEPVAAEKPVEVEEPTVTAEPEPEPVAVAETEPAPEPEAQVAAEPSPEPEAEPEPVFEPDPEALAALVAVVEQGSEQEPEPTAVAEGEAEAERAEPEPAAADGEDAPQGPPAADDESRTGGAGGNPEAAEGEAEAEQPTPEAAAADGETAPQGPPAGDDESSTGGAGGNPEAAEGEAEAEQPAPEPAAADGDAKPEPAIPLSRLKSRAPSLATAYKAATGTLKKTGLTGTRAKLYLVLDRSASMRPYYKDGSAQALADQTLALAAHLDPEATVHVVFFSTELDGTTDLTLTPDHETKIDDTHAELGRMGRTSYHVAVEEVVAHHDKHAAPGTPALVIFQTDGAPDAKTPATQSLTEAAKNHPDIHFAFVAFGEHDNKAFDYLRKLKTGNTSFFHAGPTPRELTDAELYTGVLADWQP